MRNSLCNTYKCIKLNPSKKIKYFMSYSFDNLWCVLDTVSTFFFMTATLYLVMIFHLILWRSIGFFQNAVLKMRNLKILSISPIFLFCIGFNAAFSLRIISPDYLFNNGINVLSSWFHKIPLNTLVVNEKSREIGISSYNL